MEVSATGARVQAEVQIHVLRAALDAARRQAAVAVPADPSGLTGAAAARDSLKGVRVDVSA
ncbi:MAG: hypothetical protein MUE51_05915 [Thermoleophilia bacterium]|jgi:hypothetical protein|nr:hypothetical protein [Thermoleophilia bacterium]